MLRLVVLSLLAQPALAAAQGIDATDPEAIAALLRAEGYTARVGADSHGDPKIDSGSQGADWILFFYGCTENRDCQSVQFYAGFDLAEGLPVERLNDWNRGNRFGRAYADADGDPIIEFDVNLAGGVSEANLRDTVGLWSAVLRGFMRHIGW